MSLNLVLSVIIIGYHVLRYVHPNHEIFKGYLPGSRQLHMAAQQFGSIYYRTWFGAGWVSLNMMETLDFLWQKRMEIRETRMQNP